MPIEFQPLIPQRPLRDTRSVLKGDWQWVARQDFDVNRAWKQIGNNRRGTVEHGPSFTRLLEMGNEQAWAVVPPKPALTSPVLGNDEKEFYKRQLGAIDLNLADPLTTLRSISDQSAQWTGEDSNPFAWLNDVGGFLQSKDIDMFGLGSTGAPARAADYALAFPIAVFNKMFGQHAFERDPNDPPDVQYKWQADPRYWTILTNPATTSSDLDHIARALIGQYADPNRNSYLVEQVRHQMDVDRQAAEALTSGNDAVDYAAIKMAANSARAGKKVYVIGRGMGWTVIPFVGTQIAETIEPISDDERLWWAGLDREVRQEWLAEAGMQQLAKDFISAIPALSGFGTVLSVAKAGGVAGNAAGEIVTIRGARTLYQAYDWTTRAAGVVMGAGLVSAGINWAAEAYWPEEYGEFGQAVDLARPISGSHLAGVVNAIGYWSSGTYGGWNVAKGTLKGVGAVNSRISPLVSRAISGPKLVPGTGPEMTLYSQGHGGAVMANRLVREGLNPQGLSLSQKRLTLSYVAHLMRKHAEDTFRAIINGEKTGSAAIDELPIDERVLFANEYLRRTESSNPALVEAAFRILNTARVDEGLFKTAEEIHIRDWVKRNARTIDDEVGKAYIQEYGPNFILRTTGGNDAASMRTWVEAAFERMGLDPRKLGNRRTREQWEQTVRAVYHYEFDRANGLMTAAAEGSGEAGRISLMSSRHVFGDEIDDLLPVLRGEDETAAKALVADLVANKIEVEHWYSQVWKPTRKTELSVAEVNPKKLADYLEDIAATLPVRRGNPSVNPETLDLPLNSFHRDLKADGLWEIGYKPQDENGHFVSYVRTRDGHTFRSPWLEYPMSSVDMIELGNRNLLRSKLDGIFRGFRTWRLSEFQRGSLYRNLTGDFPFTASQIDEFHNRVLSMAREYSVQPQTTGTVRPTIAGIGHAWAADVQRVATEIFGAGPYVTRAGTTKAIDWQDVIAKAYRQSLKLNLTAGLTSHLKSRFGDVGGASAWFSDIAYVNVRFNFSPIFKWSEFAESLGFSAMRGANPFTDPWNEALMFRAGAGNDYGVVMQELTYDQWIAGQNRRNPVHSVEQRQAQSFMWHARHAPEDLQAAAERATAQAEAADLVAAHGGGIIEAPPYPREPGARAGFIDEIPEGYTQTPVDLPDIDLVGDGIDPSDAGFWHTTTNLTGVLQRGLLSRAELTAIRRAALAKTSPRSPHVKLNVAPSMAATHGVSANYRQGVIHMEADVLLGSKNYRSEIFAHEVGHVVESRFDTRLMDADFTSRIGFYDPDKGKFVVLSAYGGNVTVNNPSEAAADVFMWYVRDSPSLTPAQREWMAERIAEDSVIEELATKMRETSDPLDWLDQSMEEKLNLLSTNADEAYQQFAIAVGKGAPADELANLEQIYKDAKADLDRASQSWMEAEQGGLGQMGEQTDVSLTISIDHAGEMADRLRIAVRAARGEVDAEDIIDHFAEPGRFGDDPRAISEWLHVHGHIDKVYDDWVPFLAEMKIRYPTENHDLLYSLVQSLDRGLAPHNAGAEGWNRSVVLLTPSEQMARVNPDAIGTVKVAVKRPVDRTPTALSGQVTPDNMADPATWQRVNRTYMDMRAQIMRAGGRFDPQIEKDFFDARNHLLGVVGVANRVDELEGAVTRFTVRADELDSHFLDLTGGEPLMTVPPDTPHVEATGMHGPGPDTFEYRFPSDRIFVIDDRPVPGPIARGDRDKLLEQLRQTLAPEVDEVTRLENELAGLVEDSGDFVPGMEWRGREIIEELKRIEEEVPQADRIEDVFGTPEYLEATVGRYTEAHIPGWRDKLKTEGWSVAAAARKGTDLLLPNPIPYKQRQASRLQIKLVKDGFPSLLRATGMDGPVELLTKAGIPEQYWADFLVQDKELLGAALETGHPDDWAKLMDFWPGQNEALREGLNELYASEDWEVITALWTIAGRTAADEAFRVHFFNPYRSAFERSINHPLLGVYPASWAYKAAQEWVRFLFNNETFGLNMHMTPVVAINNIVDAQNVAFAQTNPDTLEHYTGRQGPLGSTFFIFNLLMPGDWSSIPFPLSRTIRDVIRGNTDWAYLAQQQAGGMGLFRDLRLISEMLGEVDDYTWGPTIDDPDKPWSPRSSNLLYKEVEPRR